MSTTANVSKDKEKEAAGIVEVPENMVIAYVDGSFEKSIGRYAFGCVILTPDGEEFVGYARQVVEQYALIEARYVDKEKVKKKFGVSMQHYSFAVQAFVEMVRRFGMERYEFSIYETQTYDVIENVKNFRSELGILYLNDFNRKVLWKIFEENNLEFHELFDCQEYVYLWSGHPLAKKKEIALEDLEDYPFLSFDQGSNNSFYFAEEVFSTYEYKQSIKANDRATMLNLMKGLNGYTLCSGIICENLNGSEYCAVKLSTEETMTIGYLKRKGIPLSSIGKEYLKEISKYNVTIQHTIIPRGVLA